MKIRTRLLVLLIPAIFIVLATLAFFTYLNANKQAEELANAEALRIASTQSALIFSKLSHAEAVALSLSSILVDLREAEADRQVLSYTARGATRSSKDFFGVWILWEPNAYDGNDAEFIDDEDFGNSEGRANAYWLVRSDGSIGYDLSDNYDHEDYYSIPKQKGKMTIIPPYRDNDTEQKTLMSTIAAPIMANGKFLGAVGIDIEMEFIQGLLKEVKPFETGYAMLISDTGAIVSDPNQKEVTEELPQVSSEILAKIRLGEPFVIPGVSVVDNSDVLCYYTPVKLECFNAPWYFMVALPVDKVMAESNRNLVIQLGISLLALMVLIALVFATANNVSKPLQRIVAYANGIASGKYDDTVSDRGFAQELVELHGALTRMVASLLEVMRKVEESSAESAREAERAHKAMDEAEKARIKTEENHKAMMEVAGRVDAISQKVRDTSGVLTGKIAAAGQQALEQNSIMDETAIAVSSMSNSIVRVSSNAEDAAEFAQQTKNRASEGATVVNKTLGAIDGILKEIETLDGQISVLSKNTEAVGAILGLINDIADQTNLLALNAAIEAARAGEYGRGFAVVADEVRKLAEKTMEATKQVDTSIKSIRESMRISAEGVERTSRTVHDTVDLGHEAQKSLEDIVALVQGMHEQVHDIAGHCREQAASSEQVSSAVEGLRALSSNVSTAMREGADISNALVPEAQELGLLVEQLTNKR